LATVADTVLTRRRFLEWAGAVLALSLLGVRGRRSSPAATSGGRFLSCWSPRAPTSREPDTQAEEVSR
jgi:hypothetical protein